MRASALPHCLFVFITYTSIYFLRLHGLARERAHTRVIHSIINAIDAIEGPTVGPNADFPQIRAIARGVSRDSE